MTILKLSQIPLSTRILIAMAIGLIVGSVNAPLYSMVSHLADAFVMLLQMTALPYIRYRLLSVLAVYLPVRQNWHLKVP